jgi:hypothetical protein
MRFACQNPVKAQIFGFALHDKKIRFFSVWLVFSSPAQLSVFPSAEVTDLLHFLYQNIFSIVRLKSTLFGIKKLNIKI